MGREKNHVTLGGGEGGSEIFEKRHGSVTVGGGVGDSIQFDFLHASHDIMVSKFFYVLFSTDFRAYFTMFFSYIQHQMQ